MNKGSKPSGDTRALLARKAWEQLPLLGTGLILLGTLIGVTIGGTYLLIFNFSPIGLGVCVA